LIPKKDPIDLGSEGLDDPIAPDEIEEKADDAAVDEGIDDEEFDENEEGDADM